MWPFKKEEKLPVKEKEATLTVRYRSGRSTTHIAVGEDPSVFADISTWWTEGQRDLVFTFKSGEFFCLCRDDVESMYVNN